MMKNIPVRIGWELFVPLFLIIFFPLMLDVKSCDWKELIPPSIIFGIILFLIFTIKYKVDSEFLYIKNSVFGTTKIKVEEITKIEKTWNLISSPAPGIIGRVEIFFQSKSIIISPKDYNYFENELLKINPNITLKK